MGARGWRCKSGSGRRLRDRRRTTILVTARYTRIANPMDYIIGQNKAAPSGAPMPARQAGPGAPAAGGGSLNVHGDQRNFMAEVIEASKTVPVLVDFWATWCGPCKQLTPALEKVTRAAEGRIKLVKIDIDANRALVQQLTQLGLPLQSVPTVAAFWQGQILALFPGALPERQI